MMHQQRDYRDQGCSDDVIGTATLPVCSAGAPAAAAAPPGTALSTDRPRILFLNRCYWPDTEATGQLLTELCETLAGRFRITVLAGQPNKRPAGTTAGLPGRTFRRGVEICRVGHFRFPKHNLWGRTINLLSFLAVATVRSLVLSRPDVIVAETDPPLCCLLGRLLRRRFGCRLVLYLQDIYPDVALAVGKLRPGRIAGWLSRTLYTSCRSADLVIVLSQDMRQRMLQVGVAADRLACVPNWADTQLVRPVKQDNVFRRRHGLQDRLVVMYSGNIGLTQRLEIVLRAAELLRDRDDIVLMIVGDGVSRHDLMSQAERRKLPNVRFLPFQPKEQLADSLSAADVHLVPLAEGLPQCLMPSKLYTALASGTPVVAMAPESCELAQLVQRHGVGIVVPPADHVQLAQTLLWFASHSHHLVTMGAAARRLAVAQFDRSQCTAEFAQLLDRVLHCSGADLAASSTRHIA